MFLQSPYDYSEDFESAIPIFFDTMVNHNSLSVIYFQISSKKFSWNQIVWNEKHHLKHCEKHHENQPQLKPSKV